MTILKFNNYILFEIISNPIFIYLNLYLFFKQTVMITGDNPLTACHVASTLKMNEKKLIVLTKHIEQEDGINSAGEKISI